MLGKYCGSTLPPNLVSSTNSIFIHFKSDGSATGNGFHLEYNNLNCDAPIELIGNGVCNDEANNEECIYDGGDCCGSCVVTEHCTECQCLGGVDGIELSSPSIGDGYCQDGNNNIECNYDGGDCCGDCPVNQEHCTECICHEGGEPMIDISCK